MVRRSFGLTVLSVIVITSAPALAQEKKTICEVKPIMRCLDKSKIEGTTINVPAEDAAIQKDGLRICDSSYNYTTSPDIVLIMDNTGSMRLHHVQDSIPRWCPDPAHEPSDPGCISGDPDSLRGPALQTFLDSALVKGGGDMNVGVVLFNQTAEAQSAKLVPLTSATKDSIKASIKMEADGQTNYYAAFRAALDLLKTSKKPKNLQFIIFVSDGRPNYPTSKEGGDPYLYKQDSTVWGRLPVTHCIFLGSNVDNYKDMQEIASHTGGSFLNISDVSKLASYLTDDLSKTLFARALPTLTTVTNLTNKTTFQIGPEGHVALPDSAGAYVLEMPGPLYLSPGNNDIAVKTEYGYSGKTQDVHFSIQRATNGGPYFNSETQCRDLSTLVLYNAAGQPISLLGLPYLITDSTLKYTVTTGAKLDSFNVVVRVQGLASSQSDFESIRNDSSNYKDSTWSNSRPFQHQQIQKKKADGFIQVDHGETVVVTYQNPFIPEDSASAKARVKYGVDVASAAYWDLNSDGRIETVIIQYSDPLGALPSRLQFTIVDADGNSNVRTAGSDEIAFGTKAGGGEDREKLVVTFKDPFPYAVTSVANADSSGQTFRQDDVPMVSGKFRVDDSVPPVIKTARVESGNKLRVVYSEPVKLAVPSLEPIVFKRDTVVFNAKQIPIVKIDSLGNQTYVFTIDPAAEFKPVGRDSVAINNNGETSEAGPGGLTPKSRTYTEVGGSAPTQSISGFSVSPPKGLTSDAEVTDINRGGFVAIDSMGYPIPGTGNGKCGYCQVGHEGAFTGSVISIVAKEPVEYTFTIFTNLGQRVSTSKGRIDEADLPLLRRNANGEYVQRVVWTGVTDEGAMASTGAYVLKADFHFNRSFHSGAPPKNETKLTRFGFLRNCCSSVLPHWYDGG